MKGGQAGRMPRRARNDGGFSTEKRKRTKAHRKGPERGPLKRFIVGFKEKKP